VLSIDNFLFSFVVGIVVLVSVSCSRCDLRQKNPELFVSQDFVRDSGVELRRSTGLRCLMFIFHVQVELGFALDQKNSSTSEFRRMDLRYAQTSGGRRAYLPHRLAVRE